MDARISDVRPPLFVRVTPDGQRWEFTATPEGGCAVLRGGGVVKAGDGTEASVDRLVDEFLLLSGSCPTKRPREGGHASNLPVPPGDAGPGPNPCAA